MADRDRRGAERRGRRAEWIALWWLRLKGYRILSLRFKCRLGEIDIIAQKGRTLAFIEVKQRAAIETALHAVTPTAWQRIARAAHLWAGQNRKAQSLDWRFDLIAIAPRRWPRHNRDYWRP
ncbi:MAG: YraN family protein [Pseudomonadota bacterium]